MFNHKRIIKTGLMATAFAISFAAYNSAIAFPLSHAVYYEPSMTMSTSIIAVSNQTQADSFIRDMGENAIGFLSDHSLDKAEKKEKFRALLQDNFDIKTIGRFALGSNWKKLDDAQKQEYMTLFEELIVSIYATKFSKYENQKFTVDKVSNTGSSDSIVHSRIVRPNGQSIDVNWHVREKGGRLNIIDVSVENVSLAVSKKSEFGSIIQRSGGKPEALLKHMRKQIG